MGFEWMMDPTAWAGLAMLVVLEIVLGIDNLVFIAILTDKLPPQQQDRARLTGLTLALGMRLVLLGAMSWIVTLTQPIFSILDHAVSGRDLVLILGGVFLLFKATMELHERLEGGEHSKDGQQAQAVFWQVIAQIVVLDAVFSIDSVITAVGMVKELMVMMIAVAVAMAMMMLASRPLMTFVGRHPTVVILCLGFLLMIGFSLIIEGFGVHVPKGYLYAAIGFSVGIEALNQIARQNVQRRERLRGLRESTARAVLRLLGGGQRAVKDGAGDTPVSQAQLDEMEIFAPEEREMIRQVLKLGERPVRAIMIPRPQVMWLELNDEPAIVLREIEESGRSRFPVCRGTVDEVVGVVHAKDLLDQMAKRGAIDLAAAMREPLFVAEGTSILKTIERFKGSNMHMAIVLDEHGSFEGLITPADLFAAIAGDLPELEGEDRPEGIVREDGSWLIDGRMLVEEAMLLLGVDEPPENGGYVTLAGFVLQETGHIPEQGETFVWNGWRFEIAALDGRRIDKLIVRRETETVGS